MSEFAERLERYESAEYGDQLEKYVKQNERRSTRHSRLPLKLAAAAMSVQALSFVYHQDVAANQQWAAESQPELRTINQEFVGDSNAAVFYLAGFDTQNADVFGTEVGVSIHQVVEGEDISINYGDAPLDPQEIATRIIEAVDERNFSTISLVGNSLGGLVAARVAEFIIVNTDIGVESITLYATPDGSEGLRPDSEFGIKTMITIFNAFDDSVRYSSFARYALTLAQESDRFAHEENLFETVGELGETSEEVWEQVETRRRPGMWLLVDQALAVTRIDLRETLQTIGEHRGERRMPVIIYMRAATASDDIVVDVEHSGNNTCQYAYDAELDCTIIYVPNAIHTSYGFDVEAFTNAIAPHASGIRAEILNESARYAHRGAVNIQARPSLTDPQ